MRLVLTTLLLILTGLALASEDPVTLKRIGDQAFDRQDWHRAETAYHQALTMLRNGRDPGLAAAIRHQLAFTYLSLDRPRAALPLFLANLEYHQATGHPAWAAPNFLYAGRLLVESGDFERAIRLLRRYPAEDDPDPERRAQVIHWHILALEAVNRRDAARRLLAAARERLPEEVFRRVLQRDAERLAPPPPDPLWRLAPALLAIPLLLALVPALRRRYGHWILLALSTTAALIAAELLTRMWLPDPGAVRHFLNLPGTVLRFRPAPGLMPGIDYTQSTFTVNDVGLRGDDLATARGPRILVIGGSSVEALFVDDPDAWPHHAQTTLARRGVRAWIANAGKSGLDSFAHRVQLHHALRELHPDGIVIQLGINDLNRCISGGRARYLADARRSRLPDFFDAHPGVYAQVLPPNAPRLALARLLFWHHRSPAPETAHAVPQDTAGAYLREQRRRRADSRIIDEVPDVEDCLRVYRDNLRALIQAARRHDVPIAFFTQGNLYRPDLDPRSASLLWFGSVDAGFFDPTPPRHYYSVRVMSHLMARYNQALLAVCHEATIPCLDVDRLLPKDTRSYYDDVHLNRNGSLRLGEALADFLQEHRWLPRNY